MFAARFNLFTLLGFRVVIDVTWFFLAFYLVVTLASRYFPGVVPHQNSYMYVVMGIAGAAGLFLSIVLHEMAHAYTARRFDLPVGDITLFIFGGVAEIRQEPQTPRAEFWVALMGPVASVGLAALFYALMVESGPAHPAASGVFSFLALANTMLALFNLAPAFPLDGGRILRSLIWWRTGNLRRATRISAAGGSVFGAFLVVTGLLQLVNGNMMGGTWLLLIGLFVAAAASQARGITNAAENLRGVRVDDLMERNPVTVAPDLTVERLVRDTIYPQNRKFVVVTEASRAFGFIGPEQIRRVPESQWSETYVRAITEPFTFGTVVSPTATAFEALRKLQANSCRHLAVLEGTTLLGTVSETDFLNYVTLREELALPKKVAAREPATSER
ncbi:peptidase M50 [Rhodomicrobium vannielii ATCC 17100]|uniref:Zinc metalloprotease n=1 Tax=Rhodomicrobium vannielii (strain ATCC 17100 / DSM 162 / LMG 4299 / NCIMB 10020 / ATH 3.1.1) TaxID=648757 RepID=E3I5W5_RHOVT|nr:site-2 protease family protein [Rhodomicrobium vannielii]ADP69468.1 peptidase M50 [Rhodomicrobium vannielii ATCC 17100]